MPEHGLSLGQREQSGAGAFSASAAHHVAADVPTVSLDGWPRGEPNEGCQQIDDGVDESGAKVDRCGGNEGSTKPFDCPQTRDV